MCSGPGASRTHKYLPPLLQCEQATCPSFYVQDAMAMQEKLEGLGFEVEILIDGRRYEVQKCVARLQSRMKAKDVEGTAVVVYFSGHVSGAPCGMMLNVACAGCMLHGPAVLRCFLGGGTGAGCRASVCASSSQ